MVTKIKSTSFSGTSNIFNGTLAAVIQGLAASEARRVVASLGDVTDNGGGTADVEGIIATEALTAFEAGTADAVLKSEFEATAGVVRDGLKEIVAQVNVIAAKVPAFPTLTDSMGGTAADGTIAVIDDTTTGTDAAEALVGVVGAQAVIDTIEARTQQASYFVNKLLYALGMAQMDTELEPASIDRDFAAVSTDTGDAVGGTDAAEDASASKAEVDAVFDIMSDNIKTLSTALNSMTADANANAAIDVVFVS